MAHPMAHLIGRITRDDAQGMTTENGTAGLTIAEFLLAGRIA